MGEAVVAAVLADWRTAPIGPKVSAMIGFLEKMNSTPELLGPEDAAAVRAAGISEEAIDDALYVSAAFNIIVRIADAFEFELQSPAALAVSAQTLLKRGYT